MKTTKANTQSFNLIIWKSLPILTTYGLEPITVSFIEFIRPKTLVVLIVNIGWKVAYRYEEQCAPEPRLRPTITGGIRDRLSYLRTRMRIVVWTTIRAGLITLRPNRVV